MPRECGCRRGPPVVLCPEAQVLWVKAQRAKGAGDQAGYMKWLRLYDEHMKKARKGPPGAAGWEDSKRLNRRYAR